ncbi:MAG: cysteine hydrolase [Deltaproteobacteria bacterium]
MASRESALLVIDMLEDFVRPGAPLEVPGTRKILPALANRIRAARRRGELVVYLCDSHRKNDPEFSRMGWPPHAVAGTPGAAVVGEISPSPGDVVVEKKSYSGFYRTGLSTVLRRRGIRSLSLSGCVTNICVLYTAADAAMRGYDVTVEERLVAGLDPGSHAFALDQMESVLGVQVVREARVPGRKKRP